jgi:large conductance mechanosensitive channel protein
MRGNVVELATAVIIGAAFGGVADGLIKGIIDPLIAVFAPGEVKDLQNALVFGPFHIGLVLSALVNFVLKAGVVYFLHRAALRQRRGEARGRAGAAARGRGAPHRDPRPAEEVEVESPLDGPGRLPTGRPGGVTC